MSTEPKWFTVGAPGFEAAEVEARVMASLLLRLPEGLPVQTVSARGVEEFEAAVADVRNALGGLSVQVSIRDERLPVGNAFWNRIKAQFHALTVLYVNELAGRQTVINSRYVDALDALVLRLNAESEQRERQINMLELEVARLREQVARLSKGQD